MRLPLWPGEGWCGRYTGKKIFNWKTFGYCANYNLINGRRGERIISFRHRLRRCLFHFFFLSFCLLCFFFSLYFGWMITVGATHSYQNPWKFRGWRSNIAKRHLLYASIVWKIDIKLLYFTPARFLFIFDDEREKNEEKKLIERRLWLN